MPGIDFKNSFRILFVDDDPVTHNLIKVYLKEWDVSYSLSGEDALQILDKENIQIVITDINMPDMDGIELLRRIKSKHGTTQVIMLTAEDEISHLINALSLGANDFLLKPVTKADLEAALCNTIEKISRWKKAMKDIFQKKRNSKAEEK